MEDTTSEVKEIYRQILMSRTEEDRFLMCADMFETARKVIISNIPSGISEQDQKRYLYERTYGEPLPDDFFNRKR